MLKKTCELSDFKLAADGSGSFSGYGSTFSNFDRAGEAVVKGAFAKTLDRFSADGFIAVGHDWGGLPVATIEEAHEDAKGLFIKGEFHSTEGAQAARTVVKERLERGKSVGLSIGYEVRDAENTKDGRLLKEIELYEVSIVTVPCNPQAQAVSAKAEALEAPEAPEAPEASAADGSEADPEAEPTDTKISAPPAGASFEDQLSAALAAVEAVSVRAIEIAALRAKSGRSISSERRSQIAALKAALDLLLLEPEPPTSAVVDVSHLIALRLKHRERTARLLAG